MKLSKSARKTCTIVTPWGLYEYLLVPIGIVMSSNVFQVKLAEIFSHLSHALEYINDIVIIRYGTFDKYLKDTKQVLDILCNSGIQVNPVKCT